NVNSPMATRTSRKLVIAVLSLLFVAGLAIVLPSFIRATTTTSRNACVNNLRQLDGAKQQWVLENHKTMNDIPSWQDVLPYLRQKPVCPQGGTYILEHAGEPPRCSLG